MASPLRTRSKPASVAKHPRGARAWPTARTRLESIFRCLIASPLFVINQFRVAELNLLPIGERGEFDLATVDVCAIQTHVLEIEVRPGPAQDGVLRRDVRIRQRDIRFERTAADDGRRPAWVEKLV